MMSDRVDPATMVCHAHQVGGCVVCMVDDFHAWLDERHARRQRIKLERRALTVAEKYDLGGEG
jgi:hypothetical protein